jgi:hypothetical protein
MSRSSSKNRPVFHCAVRLRNAVVTAAVQIFAHPARRRYLPDHCRRCHPADRRLCTDRATNQLPSSAPALLRLPLTVRCPCSQPKGSPIWSRQRPQRPGAGTDPPAGPSEHPRRLWAATGRLGRQRFRGHGADQVGFWRCAGACTPSPARWRCCGGLAASRGTQVHIAPPLLARTDRLAARRATNVQLELTPLGEPAQPATSGCCSARPVRAGSDPRPASTSSGPMVTPLARLTCALSLLHRPRRDGSRGLRSRSRRRSACASCAGCSEPGLLVLEWPVDEGRPSGQEWRWFCGDQESGWRLPALAPACCVCAAERSGGLREP